MQEPKNTEYHSRRKFLDCVLCWTHQAETNSNRRSDDNCRHAAVKTADENDARVQYAFAEAEAEKAILFLDEIDGLVQSRSKADHSWEVTQVNELLQQMENFSGVMIGATNFFENLDPAVLRRFTFKLEFGG